MVCLPWYAFEDASVECVGVQEEDLCKDSTSIMQLLHNNLALWEVVNAEGGKDNDKGKCMDEDMDQVVVLEAARAERKAMKAAMKATKKLKAVEKAVSKVEKVAVMK